MNNQQSVFISYSSRNTKFALKLATDLQAHGIQVWLDKWNITGRAPFREEIDGGIQSSNYFLFIISPHSLERTCVALQELDYALLHHKKLIFVMARSVNYKKMSFRINPGTNQIHNFVELGYEEGLKRVLRVFEVEIQPAQAKTFLPHRLFYAFLILLGILVAGLGSQIFFNNPEQAEVLSRTTIFPTPTYMSLSMPSPQPTTHKPNLILFREEDALFIYVPADDPISLEEVIFVVSSQNKSYSLKDFRAFQGLDFSDIRQPLCFVLQPGDSRASFPMVCLEDVSLHIENISAADVFWFDVTTGQHLLITLMKKDQVIGVCPAANSMCEFSLFED